MDRSAGEGPFTDGDARGAFEQGNRLAENGDLSGAEEAYRRADEGGHPTAAAYVGVFDEVRGETRAAADAYRRADERGDGFGASRLGLLQSQSGDWDAASDSWRRAQQRGYAEPPFDPAAMMRRQTGPATVGPPAEVSRSTFASPVLIGAVTVLVAIIAVFLAYNSNSGLPFVPSRQLKVDVTNGAQLVAGNDVDEGGLRIGLVSQLQPVELPNGQVGAQLTLQLDKSSGKIPLDSRATIRPRSVLGLKYLDILRGQSSRTFSDGGVMPISQTNVPVQLEDINTLFDAKTRPAIQQDLAGYGDALTARGSALNDTIASLPQLFGHLQPVAHYLADPHTQLTRLLVALNGFMSTVSPVAQVNARLFADQATTFEAISRDPNALENTIRESPPTLDVSTASLKAQQPLYTDLTTFSNYLAPATAQLRQALPNINPALEAGIKVLPRTPSTNQKLESVLSSLKSLADDPGTNIALNGLTATVGTLNPMIRYLGPYVTVCNNWNVFWTELADLVSEQTSFGMAQRALIMFGNRQANSPGAQGAAGKANGYRPGDAPDAGYPGDAEYFHGPDYSAAINQSGTADCEIGQYGYPAKLNHLDPQGNSWETDAHFPGSQGTTWSGLSRVPQGETYSRNPATGPQLPYIPSNP
ncbi:MAG TPA: MlaD family protein [Solirubrobacteraceae bacterium]|jgi:virulence factor Mce-like protein